MKVSNYLYLETRIYDENNREAWLENEKTEKKSVWPAFAMSAVNGLYGICPKELSSLAGKKPLQNLIT